MKRGVAADTTTDAALVARCLDGEGRAWTALIDRHGRIVWSVLLRAGLSEADAQDGFQNTWTIALEELHRLRDAERVGAWIARIARHQAMRIRRRYGIARKAHPHVAREDVDLHVPDEDLQELERRDRVHAALERLGDPCAALLRLLYLTDPKPAYEGVAEELGMRIGSIGPTRARCLSKLRERLEGEDDA